MKFKSIFGKGNRRSRKNMTKKKKADAQKGVQTSTPGAPAFGERVIDVLTRSETISVFLLLLFLIAALSSLFVNPQPYQRRIHEGDISLKDVYAPYDFTYLWEVDEEKTEEARKAAYEGVLYIVRRDVIVEREVGSGLERFFNALEEEKAREVSIDEKVTGLKDKTGINISSRDFKTLLEYTGAKKLREKTAGIAKNILLKGVINKADLKDLEKENVKKIVIFNEEDGTRTERFLNDLLVRENVPDVTGDYVLSEFDGDRKLKQAITALIDSYLVPSVKPDAQKTAIEKEAAAKGVEPLYKVWTVKKNELVIERGKRVNARHIAQLMQMRSVVLEGKPTTFFTGILLLFLLLGLVAAIYLKFTHEESFLHKTKELAIVLLNMLFMIVVSDFIIRGPQPSYFIPLASTGMIITLLVGFNPAFLSVIFMSVIISVLAGGKIEVALVLLVGGTVGLYAVRGARRRASILWAGLLVGVAKLLAVICAGLINGIEMEVYIRDGLWGISSGILSGFIVLGLLPLFEHFFKVPTDISLLELSDLNHPILKELAIEAPGTYHHSILVGNLAEAATDSIGANSLLARVGAYYHDIGKIEKASYYSENEMGAGSRHEKLTPSMSALIISKHVKEGLEMARKHKLNSAILDFIAQHHGNSLISYFYQEALKKAEGGVVPNEENFRYPGPKPQTKETAIVLLADAVEAVSRTLDEPTPSSISNLVKKVINNKFIDGQLDECDLTLKDIHDIADSFVRVLMGVFHTRLDYPEDTKEKKEKSASDDKNKLQKPKQQKKS